MDPSLKETSRSPTETLDVVEIFGTEQRRDNPLVARAMRQVLRGDDLPALSELHRTDAAAARDFAFHASDRLRFDHRLGRWRYFDPPIWRLDTTGEAMRRLQEFHEGLAIAAVSDRESSKQERDQTSGTN